jgi:hypothetical protein
VKAGAHFAVGGVGQTLSAWISGDVHMEPDEIADHLAALIVGLTDPSLYRPRVTASAAPATDASGDQTTGASRSDA